MTWTGLLLAIFALSDVSLAEGDTTAMLQVSHRDPDDEDWPYPRDPDDDPCQCLNWQASYDRGAECGHGHELDFVRHPEIPGTMLAKVPNLAFEFCEMYFKSLPNQTFCMNDALGEDEPKQWCYVAPICENGHRRYGGRLKQKFCTPGKDLILGTKNFETFASWAFSMKMEMGLMVQFAYPTWKGEKLSEVLPFFGVGENRTISDSLRERLQRLVDSGKTTFFSSESGHPPFGVVEGRKLYYINFSEANKRRQEAGEDVWKHKEEMNAWGCISGCDKVVDRW